MIAATGVILIVIAISISEGLNWLYQKQRINWLTRWDIEHRLVFPSAAIGALLVVTSVVILLLRYAP